METENRPDEYSNTDESPDLSDHTGDPAEPIETPTVAANGGVRGDTLAASFIILLVLMVVQRGVGFLRGVLFCKWLDPDQLGQWDMAFGFLMLASPAIMFGLPGSFGRYVEHYRKQGQLRDFLYRIGRFVLVTIVVAVAVGWIFRDALSKLIFGSDGFVTLAAITIVALAAVAAFGYLNSLLIALRQVRVASIMNFAHGILFAVLGVTLLLAWRTDATGVVLAFGGASGIVAAVGVVWILRIWKQLPKPGEISEGERFQETSRTGRAIALWRKIVPFAFWLWVTNWVVNLFYIADRMMIIHFGGFSDAQALAVVGQYHTARIFPVLFVGVAEMLSTTATPHLTADWESGNKSGVIKRLGSLTLLVGLGFTVASLCVLAIAPILFEHVWGGRYAAGQEVLPWTLAISVWMGMLVMANNYLWCAERSRWVCLPLAVGLGLNIVFNMLLLPIYGLQGAVWATAIGAGTALIIQAIASHYYGMRYNSRILGVALLPIILGVSPWIALVVSGIMIYATRGDWLPIVVDRLAPIWAMTKGFFARDRQSA